MSGIHSAEPRIASRRAAQTVAPLLTAGGFFLAPAPRMPPVLAHGGAASPAAAPAARPELELQVGHNGGVVGVAFFRDGKRVVSAGGDTIKLWATRTGALQRTLSAHLGTLVARALSPDGKTLVSGGEDGTLRFWDAETGMAGPV
jgi:WD40 repeat protein